MRITLCGSAKFEQEFKEWNELLTLAGHVVYSLAVYPSDHGGDKDWYTPSEKTMLDLVHKRKIDNSEAILVLNVGGYIGESTQSEILHAVDHGKQVYWLEPASDGLGTDQLV